MKKVLFLLMVTGSFISCKDEAATAETNTKDSTTTAATDYTTYPYTIKHPDTWETGSKQNTLNALKALNAFETGNVDESVTYFADSVIVRFDELEAKVSNDSLKTMFKQWRDRFKSMKVEMSDWESVQSKAKNEEYVSLWYKEKWEDKDGKKDSISVMDDLKMVNGKIVELDQKTRKFPKKKG